MRFDISWLDMDLGWKDMEGDLSRFVRAQSRRKALHTTLQERRAWLPGNYRIFFKGKKMKMGLANIAQQDVQAQSVLCKNEYL